MAGRFGAAGVLLVGALCGVGGLIAGGMQPRAEVRTLEKEVERLQERPCAERARFGEVADILRGRPWGEPTAAAPPPPEPEPGDVPAEEDPDLPDLPEDLDPSSPESIEMVQEAMELRRKQSRAALIEDARPDDAQLADLDAAYADMNRDLSGIVDDFVAQVEGGALPRRRDLMVFAADTLDVFIATEDRVNDTLTGDQLADVDPASIDPLAHIDPALVEQVMRLDPAVLEGLEE